MNDAELQLAIKAMAGKDLEQRKRWYSPAAAAYAATRPPYPEELVRRAIGIAQLSPSSRILEIGCGPGTATSSFADLGCPMVCLEPNPEFSAMARTHCRSHPSVEVLNIAFEEWDLQPGSFDAVLAANSMHWIPYEIGYSKASMALKADGFLILLWNKEPQPCAAMKNQLSEIQLRLAPSLGGFEDRNTQEAILAGLGQIMMNTGLFRSLSTATMEATLTYTADQYITLLSTYSPYLKLDAATRNALFAELKNSILSDGDNIRFSYLSTYHIAQTSQSLRHGVIHGSIGRV